MDAVKNLSDVELRMKHSRIATLPTRHQVTLARQRLYKAAHNTAGRVSITMHIKAPYNGNTRIPYCKKNYDRSKYVDFIKMQYMNSMVQ